MSNLSNDADKQFRRYSLEEIRIEEIKKNIQLRDYISKRIVRIYIGTIIAIILFGSLEGLGYIHLGESFKWLIGILAGQVSILAIISRGLFKISP